MESSFGKMHGDDTTNTRFDCLAIAVALVILILCALSAIGAALLPSDPAPVTRELAFDFLPFDSAVRPEPTERTLFIAASLLLPLLSVVVVHRLGAGEWSSANRTSRAVAAGAAVLLVAAIVNAPGTRRVFRVDQAWTLLAASAVTLVVCGASLRLWARVRNDSERHPRQRGTFLLMAVALTAVVSVIWRPLPVEALGPSFRHYANLDVVLAPVVAATNGLIPIAHYTSQYGLYAVMLAPLFDAVGLSVTTFTVSLATLHLLALGALVATVVAEVRSRMLAFAGCAAIAFVAGGYVPMRFDPDPYFQYWPIRFLWPALMVPVVWAWSRSARRRWLVLTSFAAGIAVLWNIDSGIAAAGGWLGLLFFRAAVTSVTGRPSRRAFTEFAQALGIVVLVLATFALWLRLRAGTPVGFSAVFEGHRRFYLTGFFMQPLPLRLHAWQFVAGTYVGGMVLGMAHALGRIRHPRAIVVHFLSFLGIGLFAYYQGRSTDQALVAASWPAILIVVLCADWAITLGRDGRLERPAARVLVTSALAFGIYCAAILAWDTPGIVRKTVAHWRSRPTSVIRNIAFIRANSVAGVPAPVIARFQAVYAAESKTMLALEGHPVAESVARSLGRAHVRQIEQMQPERIFVGVPYLENAPRNPYLDLLPLLARDYDLRAQTGGMEDLQLYTRRR